MLWEFLLGKETGLGWDSERQTVAAEDEWWEKKIQVGSFEYIFIVINAISFFI